MMVKLQQLNIFVIISLLYLEESWTTSCPTSCKCRGRAARCGPGLSAFPTGLDATLFSSLSVSGLRSNHSHINTIVRSDLQTLKLLFVLHITFSEVKTVGNEAFADLVDLHDLSLADNNIKALGADVFNGLTKLRTLDLSGNKGLQVDKSMFTHISQLEELSLGAMDVEEFQTDLFASLTKLKVLRLFSNRMQTFDPALIKPFGNLEVLDLTDNLLIGLPSSLQPKFSQLKSLHLAENPWQCNCQLLWLRTLPASFVANTIDSNDVVCNGPAQLKYASVMNVPDKDFLCVPPKVVRCDSDAYSVEVNHDVAISCDFDGDPVPNVKWTHGAGFEIDGRDTSVGKYQTYKNGTLVIKGVDEKDGGEWIVTAYNTTVSDKHTVRVTVTGISTTTKSTTTTTTTTTPKPITSTPTTKTILTTKPSKQTIKPTQSVKSTPLRQSSLNSLSKVPPTTNSVSKPSGKKDNIVAKNGINYGLLIAAFAAGATLVGTCFIFVMCCKRKQNSEKNKIAAFEDDLGGQYTVREQNQYK